MSTAFGIPDTAVGIVTYLFFVVSTTTVCICFTFYMSEPKTWKVGRLKAGLGLFMLMLQGYGLTIEALRLFVSPGVFGISSILLALVMLIPIKLNIKSSALKTLA